MFNLEIAERVVEEMVWRRLAGPGSCSAAAAATTTTFGSAILSISPHTEAIGILRSRTAYICRKQSFELRIWLIEG